MSYNSNSEDQRRLQRLYLQTRHSMRGGAYYDRHKNRLRRYTWNRNGITKYLRRCGNRTVRRAGLDRSDSLALRGGEYRRLYPYWWELF